MALAPRQPTGPIPVWLPASLLLIGLSVGISLAVALVTGGREVGDDAPHLLELVRAPWILWGDPAASGLAPTWQSFPPLLPPLFGLAIRPWLDVLSDFGAIRAGALLWTLGALIGLDAFARRVGGIEKRDRQLLLVGFATLPSVLAAIALLPQEESYVALFAMALVAAHHARRPLLVAALLGLTALAGKVFVLALAAPLAFASVRPWRTLVGYGAAAGFALGGFLALQIVRFGAAPLAGYEVAPSTSVSLWAVLDTFWSLPAGIVPLSAVLAGAAILAISAAGRRAGVPVLHLCAIALWCVQLGVAVAMPPYLVWNLPLLLVIAGDPRAGARRWAIVAILYLWGGVAYAAKLLGGVALAVEGGRSAGKTAIADAAVRLLGETFPFGTARTALVALLVVLGIACARLVWNAGLARVGKTP